MRKEDTVSMLAFRHVREEAIPPPYSTTERLDLLIMRLDIQLFRARRSFHFLLMWTVHPNLRITRRGVLLLWQTFFSLWLKLGSTQKGVLMDVVCPRDYVSTITAIKHPSFFRR